MADKHTMYFLINSIDLARGGLTRASLKQASTFAEMGYDVEMVTFNYNLKYSKIRKKLVEMGKVHPDVTIRNMYEELEGNNEPVNSIPSHNKTSLKELADGGALDKRSGYNSYRVYKNGLYIKYIDLDKNDTLNFIDYFNENRYRTSRVEYDQAGNIRRVSYMDFQYNKPRQIIHYDPYGNAYLSQWENAEKGKIQRINIFNPNNGEVEKTYFNDDDLKVAWLEKILKESENPVVVSDTRSTDSVLGKLDKSAATKIWRLHSCHVKYPFQKDGEIVPKVRDAIKYLDNYDGAFVLTEEQKNDLVQRYGGESFFHVVPHFHEEKKRNFLKEMIKKEKKNEKLGVIISRLSTLKRIDHPIRAFKKVVQQMPEAKLEVWGTGTETEKLEELIKELGLENNVSMKGYTHDPDLIYQKGLFSILTSKTEGFALSILESMANKTPVISYNIKYGPNELIQHDQTGLLVEDKDIEGLAESMLYMFKNPEKTKAMGEDAAEFVNEKFSKENYKERWIKSIAATQKNKK
ncbi:glycosyltransferase [Thalassobacillus pellis]|uniref:glycosyltransferase n=1 Tax=Thalassobacillus pellis TaxID=748008 RepID=UPI0019615B8F|nr:glycosyltransferase [Thalassobacillus pellis]MBM7551701.1 poly(glycerol-phosphate) alpha-glucosyltransferase [Thalassobacillus pellis]